MTGKPSVSDQRAVRMRVPAERGFKWVAAQTAQAGVGAYEKMEEHLAIRRSGTGK